MSQAARLLIIATAIVGMEVDVVSNPFAPEFVLSRFYALLDDARAADAPPAETEPAAEEAPDADSLLLTDETVALRLRNRERLPLHRRDREAPDLSPPAPSGRGLCRYAPPTTPPPAPRLLCRFLC